MSLPTSPYLTEAEVAQLFGVTTHAVRKWRNQGKLGYIKVGKTIRFDPEEIAAFIRRNRQAPVCTHGTPGAA
jgi:excisionase family DNA binding protein